MIPLADGGINYQALGENPFTAVHRELRVAERSPGPKVVHLHGLWSPLLHAAARGSQKLHWPYAVSTRGMLSGWAMGHKAWKKKLAWKLYQEADLRHSGCLVASSGFERRDISARVPGIRVEVIPNGCDARPQSSRLSGQASTLVPGVRWALALGRLHPVKGYGDLIEAWAKLRPAGWKLAIAGPDENGYRSNLEQLIRQHQLQKSVVLPGAVDDFQKWSLLDQCELFVAPSKTENFGMAIAEALQSGTPVITTTGTPWREVQEYDCGWWVRPDALEPALEEATALGADVLQAKGKRGQRLIEEKYSWGEVAARTVSLYRSILSGNSLRNPA
jgi:glycosyltransferase involved in cell wall biosynthesis